MGAAAIAAVLMAAPAQAATVIDFTTGLAGEGGTISWDGTNLIGSNIPIGAVAIVGAPVNNGVYEVSGTASGQGGTSAYGTLSFNTSADNNFITITGCIEDLSVGIDANGNCSPVALMDGTFTSWNMNGTNGLDDGFGTDVKNTQLLEAINWPLDLPWEFFGFSMTTSNLQPNGQPGSVISTDIRNTAVPEPATMMLLGTGLLAAFRARRRQA
ncbi:MAG TPA: PEP-CTERM sorting domain-containing protein [Vicinamibacterales bacterium]|nr:PEP-CTERM sorting domain-containing protein [Vicinamibacterales bacterium]